MRNSELPQALVFNVSFCFNEITSQISVCFFFFKKKGKKKAKDLHNVFLKAFSYIVFQRSL